MKPESAAYPVLLWQDKRTRGDSLYQSARKEIHKRHGSMPRIITSDPDIFDFFARNPGATLYLPVFAGSTGWWGGLLGTDSKTGPHIAEKLILSAECQLMKIVGIPGGQRLAANSQRLVAAEIHPTSPFFKKMNSQIAVALDMLATDTGTIIGLFSGHSPKKFVQMVESTGNSYLGCVGYY
ncbi:MAG: hypothetical protein FWC51_00420 [Proteobacteria bacterium]|nr:hypothetical protein [Pseudomonadota bacterium]